MKAFLCLLFGLLCVSPEAQSQNFGNVNPGTMIGNPGPVK